MKKIALFLSIPLYFFLAYFIRREEIWQLLSVWCTLFIAYFYLISADFKNGIWWGITFRIIFLIAIPALSDDVFRFLWDGNLLVKGINPYSYLPSELINNQAIEVFFQEKKYLFSHLNSPHYYSVYPPFNQLIFGVAAYFSNGNFHAGVITLRLFILLFEIGTLWLLPPSGRNFYALNPFIIVELTGNLHFEAGVIFFLVAMYRYLTSNVFSETRKTIFSACLFSLSILIKVVPLIFLPLIISKLSLKRRIVFCSIVSFISILFLLIFLNNQILQNILKSLNLYFQSFEFNASIYYLVREIGFYWKGYNVIQTAGKWLGFISFGSILFLSFWKTNLSFIKKMTLILFIYLLFSTTIHPWYIAPLVAFSALGSFRFPLLWSAALPFTYFSYTTHPYHENLWWVAFEYGIVFIAFFWEIKNSKRNFIT